MAPTSVGCTMGRFPTHPRPSRLAVEEPAKVRVSAYARFPYQRERRFSDSYNFQKFLPRAWFIPTTRYAHARIC